MKTFWAWAAKLLFVFIVVETWFFYDFYQKNNQLQVTNSRLTQELQQAEVALAEADRKMEIMEKHSIEGQLRETNKVIVSGWETLLKAVEDELAAARQSLPSLLSGESTPELPAKEEQPPVEADDTDSTVEQGPVPEQDQAPEENKAVEGERT